MSLNVVAMVGRLTADPELRTTSGGTEVVTFGIAVDRPYSKDANAQKADFFKVVAWADTALFVSRYFSKGSPIAVQGRLQSRTYEENGKKRTAIEIVAKEVSFCGSKNENSSTVPAYSSTDTSTDTSTESGFSSASYADFEDLEDDEDYDTPF